MSTPLYEKLRPKSLDQVVGQPHLIGKEGFLTRLLEAKKPLSLIFWGPPGCGKTTLAKLYAKAFNIPFVALSAVFSGVSEIKKVIQATEKTPLLSRSTLLFIDEIHRFNKSQQDAFLPYLENGTLILVGATTENPSFSLNNALLSRLRVLTLNPLDPEALEILLNRYEECCGPLPLTGEAKEYLIHISAGDGRYLLNMIENLESVGSKEELTPETLTPFIQRRSALFDKSGDGHYNLISALHKAVRGSDPDASLYWFARILEGGEDPLFIARRLIRMAIEDVGLADPEALKISLAAREAYHLLGSPEGELALAEALVYLALSPKSNALYTAYESARSIAKKTNHFNPPKIILNSPTKLMKDEGYGKGYQYDHETKNGFSGQNYLPNGLPRLNLYSPVERGFERELKKRIEFFEKLREAINKKK